jgi:hypothetical protein
MRQCVQYAMVKNAMVAVGGRWSSGSVESVVAH